MTAVRVLPAGESALVVEFGEAIDPTINARVLGLDRALADDPPPGVIETVPTYRSLMVHFDPLGTAPGALEATLRERAAALPERPDDATGRLWRLPVCYGGEFGMDLGFVAETHGLTERRLVELHAAAAYRVYMIGFAPGFAYLGGLAPELHTQRRTEPRLETPAGSVSIGGVQAAVTSMPVPSGWHMLGRTPVRTFDLRRERPFLLETGDLIRFEPVSPEGWHALDRRFESGEAAPEPEAA